MSNLLLKYGAYVNLTDSYLWTSLHIAAFNGYSRLSKLLIEK